MKDRVGFVYLLRLGKHYKIGMSKNPKTRATNFLGLAEEPALLHSIRTAQPRRLEEALHDRFSERHVRGEWFTLTEEDVTLFRSVNECQAPEDLPPALAPGPEEVGRTRVRRYGKGVSRVPHPMSRLQLNIRLPGEDLKRLAALREAMTAALGMELSKSDVLRMALAELARRYAPGATPRPRRRGKSGKGEA